MKNQISLILPLALKFPKDSEFQVSAHLIDKYSEEIAQNLPTNRLSFAVNLVKEQ